MECIILIGLQGSGKTTFYARWFAETHRHISKDVWRNSRNKERRQQDALAEAFERGDSVVVDNTNPTAAERAQIVAIARASGAHIIGYYFETSTRAAVARNATREGRARVPNVAIFTIAKKLQPPTYEEGFEQLFRVTPSAEGDPAVSEIARSVPTVR
jgi:predicted kinase